MSTTSIPGTDTAAQGRAERRLQAWADRHPQAAQLARYAALAVRVDAALLRSLRLQLMPQAEPGIEADLWWSGLHESQGHDGFVFDARVQALLRRQLADAPAARGGRSAARVDGAPRSPLDAAWHITAVQHADWPESLRTEEALTWHALRNPVDCAAEVDTLLAPALAAMASGGEARALEVARWAQRAVPRLPEAARLHPSALALWLAALLRLGLPASQLPDTGAAGLPSALQWLLPAGQLSAQQRVALVCFDDRLQLQPLAEAAPPSPDEIMLPGTPTLLLALHVDQGDGSSLLQRTLVLDSVNQTNISLPFGWQALRLRNLTGEGWQVRRALGASAADVRPLAWPQTRVLVLGASGPVGMGTFVSLTEVVTVTDVLDPDLLKGLRGSGQFDRVGAVMLRAQDATGSLHTLQARVSNVDLRSSLVLLALQEPFAGASVPHRAASNPTQGAQAFTVPGMKTDGQHVVGTFGAPLPLGDLPRGMPATDHISQHVGFEVVADALQLEGMAGAPVFVDGNLAGIIDLASPSERSVHELWAVPAPAVDRFLDWARRDDADARPVLLHYAVNDPKGKGAALDARALRMIQTAARRARVHLVNRNAVDGPAQAFDDADDPIFMPDLAGAVRLVTPEVRNHGTPAASLRTLALAARAWAQPGFGILHLSYRGGQATQVLPPTMLEGQGRNIEQIEAEDLARDLLSLVEPATSQPITGNLQVATTTLLVQRLRQLATPHAPDKQALESMLGLADEPIATRPTLTEFANLVVHRWNVSSRIDASAFVDNLAQLALPVGHEAWLEPVRHAARRSLVLNTLPAQLGRLLISRAFADRNPPPCLVVRAQTWMGQASAMMIESLVVDTIAKTLRCSDTDSRQLLRRLNLPLWIIVTTRPLPDRDTLMALELQLPSARFLFLAGSEPDLQQTARAIGAQDLPLLAEGADLQWLQGYKRLMEWARPRSRAAPRRAGTHRATRKAFKK